MAVGGLHDMVVRLLVLVGQHVSVTLQEVAFHPAEQGFPPERIDTGAAHGDIVAWSDAYTAEDAVVLGTPALFPNVSHGQSGAGAEPNDGYRREGIGAVHVLNDGV
eukprot:CAMPEP_0175958178 /NCGR_PEP_ID=MMETSP0108-20121206/34106_1 /TAXON_ID=195067 ORGANISM="Goniomonas pacifica, Strain CCMP1869" /NCGR_SAMPLE_ID=MMETSP0108 /ASSEMBLY_ACC=CAM_ASM_000204 /LENGTH=105 /DNA_ID=CAMNT_0017285509 /DNA_START=334 /DNA_END=651 /DNA_ORIENTATION=-